MHGKSYNKNVVSNTVNGTILTIDTNARSLAIVYSLSRIKIFFDVIDVIFAKGFYLSTFSDYDDDTHL